jgi:soluble lytic murein transglycosylase-like protein
MKIETLEEIVASEAKIAGLPVNLVRAFITAESHWDTFAYRYEPAFLTRYVESSPKRFGPISKDSERIGRATSWGLMQIMGQVARELGYEFPFLSGLCDPRIGVRYGCKKLVELRNRYYGMKGWEGVIAAYNAGSPRTDTNGIWVNIDYVKKVARYFSDPAEMPTVLAESSYGLSENV